MNQRPERPVVILSGGRTTRPLAAPLAEDYAIAVYDPNSLSFFRETLDRVICPAKGATQAFHDSAFNQSALYAANVVGNLETVRERINVAALDGLGDLVPEQWLPGMCVSLMASVVMNTSVLDAFVQEFDVRAVVTHEDITPVYRALAVWARERGVPSLHVPHANHFIHKDIPDVHDRCVCDRIAATSPWMRDWYVERGFPKDRIAVTGCPNWDRWSRLDLTREEARDVLRVPQDGTVVTYCTSWPQNTNYVDNHEVWAASHEAVLDAAADEGWTLIWSQHPGSPPDWRQRFAEMMKQKGLEDGLIVRGHLDLTVRASDCFVAVGPSNVIVEAAMGGTPGVTIEIEGYGFPDVPPFDARPEPGSIADAVGGAIATWRDEEQERFVQRYATANDGRATDRVAALVREMAKEGVYA